jgi:ribosomal protein S18 acetylase RimI-like enzyme
VVIDIRPRSAADSPAIARVRRASWVAAYTGIIDRAIIDRVTKAGANAADAPPNRRTLVAVGGEDPAVIGYAIFGPERTVVSAVSPPVAPANGSPGIMGAPRARAADPYTPAGRAGGTGELYALYVTPDWWSAGVGRALMDSVLAALREAGYTSAVLWVLADNTRARRFYDRAGFAPDGVTNILAGLGGVLEFRYARNL